MIPTYWAMLVFDQNLLRWLAHIIWARLGPFIICISTKDLLQGGPLLVTSIVITLIGWNNPSYPIHFRSFIGVISPHLQTPNAPYSQSLTPWPPQSPTLRENPWSTNVSLENGPAKNARCLLVLFSSAMCILSHTIHVLYLPIFTIDTNQM